MEIVWTRHADDRQRQWQDRLGITREEVEAVLTNPEQIVGEGNILVAQLRRGNGLLRVMYAETGLRRTIVTLYWTNQVRRYWQEETP